MDLNYKIYGKGERTIVLVHYFGGNGESWQWVVKKLCNKFSIVVITLPGFGNTKPLENQSIFSLANYINNCIEELSLDNYLLCGHSMGGKLILYANQIAVNNKAKGLVLIAPSPPTIEKMTEEEKQTMLSISDIEAATEAAKDATFKNLTGKKLSLAVESQLQVDRETRKWWLETGMSNDISERIPGLHIPTFVICATEDTVIPMDEIYNSVLPFLYKPRLIQLSR
ncbi:MAG: alpha/beta hydrolase, partial [Pricia sp.]